jgi:acid stress chaperone HdeB
MKNSLIASTIFLSAALLLSTPALAKKTQMQDINFGAISCGQFMEGMSEGSDDDMAVVLMWIDGYLSGVSGDTVLNWKNLEKLSANLIDYCESNPEANVLEAAEKVGISK